MMLSTLLLVLETLTLNCNLYLKKHNKPMFLFAARTITNISVSTKVPKRVHKNQSVTVLEACSASLKNKI